MRNQRSTCSCGTRPDEWEDDRDAYVPDIHFCRGHQVLDQARRAVPKDRDGQPAPGFFPHLRPRTPEDDEPLADDD